jgi:hypothetical protein
MGRPQGFILIAGGVAMVFNNTVTGTTYIDARHAAAGCRDTSCSATARPSRGLRA